MSVKLITELLIEADRQKDDLEELQALELYILANKKKYPLVHLLFMLEHLDELIRDLIRREVKMLFS